MLLSKFDPWRSTLCTCPTKLTFNPYTGCDHRCVYCYASGYIPQFLDCRPKKNLIVRLKREAARLKGELVSISNSSDPYPNLEAETRLTRKCLEILSEQNCKVQMITKSDIVIRDIDLLKKIPSMVSLTVTTEDDEVAKLIEMNAPSSSRRLKAISALVEKDIPTSVRIDPIIPFLNEQSEPLIKTLSAIGVKHITSSTLKINADNWKRISTAIPATAKKLKPLYFEKGEKTGRYTYLPKDLRSKLMQTIRNLAHKYEMEFGACREGLDQLNTTNCDGTWLLDETNPNRS